MSDMSGIRVDLGVVEGLYSDIHKISTLLNENKADLDFLAEDIIKDMQGKYSNELQCFLSTIVTVNVGLDSNIFLAIHNLEQAAKQIYNVDLKSAAQMG